MLPFGYKGAVGYYTDSDTENIYVRARTYQPIIGRWLSMDPLEFVDGTSLYRAYFVPTQTDPRGMDIYIYRSPYSLHQEVCVDTWWNCGQYIPDYRYKPTRPIPIETKRGKVCYTFGIVPGTGTWASCGSCGIGEVSVTRHEEGDILVRYKKTTCQEDEKFYDELVSHDGHFDRYSFFTKNCRHYSHHWFDIAPGVEWVYVCLEQQFEWHGNSGAYKCTKWGWVKKGEEPILATRPK